MELSFLIEKDFICTDPLIQNLSIPNPLAYAEYISEELLRGIYYECIDPINCVFKCKWKGLYILDQNCSFLLNIFKYKVLSVIGKEEQSEDFFEMVKEELCWSLFQKEMTEMCESLERIGENLEEMFQLTEVICSL